MKKRYPSSVESGSGDTNSHHQISVITARAGYNFYEQMGYHTLSYKCIDIQQDWLLQTSLGNVLEAQGVSHWAPPEVLGEYRAGPTPCRL